MSNYPKYMLACAFAEKGDKIIPPATAEDAGIGRFSQEEGWGSYNAIPIAEGGIPPKRQDFNALAYMLSQLLVWYQQGGIMKYSVDIDYEEGNEVFHQGIKYRCLKANGPKSTRVAPSNNPDFWKDMDAHIDKPSVQAGQVTAFYNCKVGGSDGRRLIPWGSTTADETYVLCDGGSDGSGGSVPNLIDRFLLPSRVSESGAVGGVLTASTNSKTISGTVGETILTLDQIPSHSHGASVASSGGHTHGVTVGSGGSHSHTGSAASAGSHSHSGSTGSAGSHSHTRGSMNITGEVARLNLYASQVTASGAFYSVTDDGFVGIGKGDWDTAQRVYLNAAGGWTGSTSTDGSHSHSVSVSSGGSHSHTVTIASGGSHSHTASSDSAGSHSHTVTVASVGGGGAHTHTLTGASHTHEVTLDRPPYYKLAFFVKIPE